MKRMKKILLTLAIGGLSLTAMKAQEVQKEEINEWVNPNHSKAQFVSVETKMKNLDAVSISFPISEVDLEEIFEEKMKSVGAARKSKKWKAVRGYRSYQALTVGEVSQDKMDYYYAIDGNKENSTVTVAVSRGYDNFLSRSTDAEEFAKIKNFLESLNNDVDTKNWEKRVMAQEDVVKESNKKLSNDQSELERLEKELENIKSNIEAKKADIDQDKQALQKATNDLELIRSRKI